MGEHAGYVLAVALTVLGAIGGFLLKKVWDKAETSSQEINDLRVLVAEKYATWEGVRMLLHEILDPVVKQLDRIEKKVDNKVDKP